MTRPIVRVSRPLILALLLAAAPLMAARAQGPATPEPKVEVAPDGEPTVVHEGKASYYGPGFQGKPTANGERFDQDKPTAASKHLPLGTTATVTNPENGREVDVRINDHGPHVRGRVIDLSRKAAEELDMVHDGVADVRVEQKPSEQPDGTAREKVDEKAQELARRGGTVRRAD